MFKVYGLNLNLSLSGLKFLCWLWFLTMLTEDFTPKAFVCKLFGGRVRQNEGLEGEFIINYH